MEILVLVMLALFILIITFCVLVYVVLRKNSVNRDFERKMDSDIDSFIETNDYDELPNVVLPLNFQSNYQYDKEDLNEDDNKIDNELLNKDNVEESLIKEIDVKNEEEKVETSNELIEEEINTSSDDEKIENDVLENTEIDNTFFTEYGFNNDHLESEIEVITDLENKNNKKERKEELVNILINKKNYPFLANNNHVNKNDHLKVLIDKKVYFGVVTKANYIKDISNMKIKPRKLIIIKNKDKVKNNNEVKKDKSSVDHLIDEMEFVPKKKKRV